MVTPIVSSYETLRQNPLWNGLRKLEDVRVLLESSSRPPQALHD